MVAHTQNSNELWNFAEGVLSSNKSAAHPSGILGFLTQPMQIGTASSPK